MTTHPNAPASGTPPSMLATIDFWRTYWRRILGTGAGLGLLAVAGLLLTGRMYSSYAKFLPQTTPGALARLSGLAAQLGLQVPAGEQGETPQFYADLVNSEGLLLRVAVSPLLDRSGRVQTAVTFLKVEEGDSGRTVMVAARRLKEMVRTAVNVKTGVVTVTVSTRDPSISLGLANGIMAELEEFNVERRQSQATAERLFLQRRLDSARVELRASEDRLQQFLDQNRDYRNAPRLNFAYDRLFRQVTARQDIVTLLSQSFEQARLTEVRDTPVFTILERPRGASLPDDRYVLLKVILAVVVGAIVGTATAVVLPRLVAGS